MEIKAKSKRMADLRAFLQAEHARLVRELDHSQLATDDERNGYTNHMADNATAVFEQARNVGQQRDHERALGDVEAALRRMEDGTYGTCLHCKEAIDLARLKAQPAAGLCFGCQQRLETR